MAKKKASKKTEKKEKMMVATLTRCASYFDGKKHYYKGRKYKVGTKEADSLRASGNFTLSDGKDQKSEGE